MFDNFWQKLIKLLQFVSLLFLHCESYFRLILFIFSASGIPWTNQFSHIKISLLVMGSTIQELCQVLENNPDIIRQDSLMKDTTEYWVEFTVIVMWSKFARQFKDLLQTCFMTNKNICLE